MRAARGRRYGATAVRVPDTLPVAMNPRLAPLRILADAGYPVGTGRAVLDFGCGAGTTVAALLEAGFDAYGCDVSFKHGPDIGRLSTSGRVRRISLSPYKIPFADASFDGVLSNNVLEHVHNTSETLSEIARVLRPGAASIHIAPAKLRPIEGHVKVPLASIVRSRAWMAFWLAIGVGSKPPKTNAWQVASKHIEYLNGSTNYLMPGRLREAFLEHFSSADFVEEMNFTHSPSPRLRSLAPLLVCTPLSGLAYRYFHTYVLLAVK